MKSSLFLAGIVALCGAGTASAATITFDGITPGSIGAALFTEAGFDLDIVNGFGGSEGAGLEYERLAGTDGTLTITRSGGGTFTFDSVDLQLEYGADATVELQGYLLGALVGSDSYVVNSFSYLNFAASTLAGTAIDELLILAERNFNGAAVDNLVLTPAEVPAPAAALLLGLGAAALIRRRARA